MDRADGPADDETIDAADGQRPKAPPAPAADDEPTFVDPRRYVRGEVVARGGMGQIVEARDRRLGRVVAIKELLPGRNDARGLFEAEARLTARLSHPAIVPVHDAGHWPDGAPFFAMKLVEGRSLEEAVRSRESLAERLRLIPSVATVADALAYAHSRRVIHRDLKPGNILLGDFGETVVIDWGLAKQLDESQSSEPSMVAGTPAYMPPEQARGLPLDERADVYALGAVLYTVIAGHAPYHGKSGRAVLESVVNGPPPADLRELGCPDDLWAIITKAMAPEPAARYPSASQLAEDLRRFLDGRLIAARRYAWHERLRRWAQRHAAIVTTAGIAVLLLAVGGVISVRRILVEREAAVAAQREAETQRRQAEQGNATLHEEAGRRELLAGRSGPALAHFLAARAGGRDSASLDFLVDEAARAFTGEDLRLGLDGRVFAAAFSPDGKQVLGADERGQVRVWNAHTGRLEWSEALGSAILVARWAPSARRVAVTTDDGRVVVFDLAKPRPQVVRAGGARAGVLVWTGDGVAFGDAEGQLVRDEQTANLGVRVDALTARGAWLAAGGEDGSVFVWPAGSQQPRKIFADPQHRAVTALDVRGTRLLVAGQDGLAVVLDADSGAIVHTLAGLRSDVRRAGFEPVAGKTLFTAGADGLAVLWRADTGERLHQLAGHGDALGDASFSLDGLFLLTAGGDGSARVWEVGSGEELARFEGHRGGLRRAGFDPHVRRVVTAGDDGTLRVFALDTGVFALPRDSEVAALAWQPDGTLLSAAGLEVVRHDVDKRIVIERLPAHGDSVVALAGEASGALDGSIFVGADELSLGAPVFALAVSPDRRFVAAGGAGRLRWWDRQGTLPGHEETSDRDVTALAFLGDTRLVVASGTRVRVLNVSSGQSLAETPAQPAEVSAVAVDSRGRLATASASTATLWKLGPEGLSPTSILLGHGRITALAFSVDGERLAVASHDGTLDIWSADGRLLWRRHRPGSLWSVGFSPDGKRLAAGGDERKVLVWDVDAPSLSPAALTRLVTTRVPWRIVDDRLAEASP